ncbi:unnamed protein product [Amoebophrya sp. A120]|nr:unnamed protein product [Amoebophrya sp. A120]|eukprot:GSA120T00025559001.1
MMNHQPETPTRNQQNQRPQKEEAFVDLLQTRSTTTINYGGIDFNREAHDQRPAVFHDTDTRILGQVAEPRSRFEPLFTPSPPRGREKSGDHDPLFTTSPRVVESSEDELELLAAPSSEQGDHPEQVGDNYKNLDVDAGTAEHELLPLAAHQDGGGQEDDVGYFSGEDVELLNLHPGCCTTRTNKRSNLDNPISPPEKKRTTSKEADIPSTNLPQLDVEGHPQFPATSPSCFRLDPARAAELGVEQREGVVGVAGDRRSSSFLDEQSLASPSGPLSESASAAGASAAELEDEESTFAVGPQNELLQFPVGNSSPPQESGEFSPLFSDEEEQEASPSPLNSSPGGVEDEQSSPEAKSPPPKRRRLVLGSASDDEEGQDQEEQSNDWCAASQYIPPSNFFASRTTLSRQHEQRQQQLCSSTRRSPTVEDVFSALDGRGSKSNSKTVLAAPPAGLVQKEPEALDHTNRSFRFPKPEPSEEPSQQGEGGAGQPREIVNEHTGLHPVEQQPGETEEEHKARLIRLCEEEEAEQEKHFLSKAVIHCWDGQFEGKDQFGRFPVEDDDEEESQSERDAADQEVGGSTSVEEEEVADSSAEPGVLHHHHQQEPQRRSPTVDDVFQALDNFPVGEVGPEEQKYQQQREYEDYVEGGASSAEEAAHDSSFVEEERFFQQDAGAAYVDTSGLLQLQESDQESRASSEEEEQSSFVGEVQVEPAVGREESSLKELPLEEVEPASEEAAPEAAPERAEQYNHFYAESEDSCFFTDDETDTLGGESSDLEELDEQSYKLLEEHEQEKAYREEQKQAEVLKQEQVRVRNPQLIVQENEEHDQNQLTQEERDLYYYPHQIPPKLYTGRKVPRYLLTGATAPSTTTRAAVPTSPRRGSTQRRVVAQQQFSSSDEEDNFADGEDSPSSYNGDQSNSSCFHQNHPRHGGYFGPGSFFVESSERPLLVGKRKNRSSEDNSFEEDSQYSSQQEKGRGPAIVTSEDADSEQEPLIHRADRVYDDNSEDALSDEFITIYKKPPPPIEEKDIIKSKGHYLRYLKAIKQKKQARKQQRKVLKESGAIEKDRQHVEDRHQYKLENFVRGYFDWLRNIDSSEEEGYKEEQEEEVGAVVSAYETSEEDERVTRQKEKELAANPLLITYEDTLSDKPVPLADLYTIDTRPLRRWIEDLHEDDLWDHDIDPLELLKVRRRRDYDLQLRLAFVQAETFAILDLENDPSDRIELAILLMAGQVVPLNEGWSRIHKEGVLVLEEFLQEGTIRPSVQQQEGKPKRIFSNADYTELYTLVYNMCTQRTPNNWQQQLYQKYGETMNQYISKRVINGLEKRVGKDLLQALLKAWSNHQLYVKWMTRFFTYLDRYYVKLQAVPSLTARGYAIFNQSIFQAVSGDTREALLQAIRSDRDGEANFSDGDIVKGVVSIFIELGACVASGRDAELVAGATGTMQGTFPSNHPQHGLQIYVQEFESHFLPDSKDYYARQAAGWLETNSFSEYLLQADQCLLKEAERVKMYLHRTTDQKLKLVLLEALLNEDTRKILLDKQNSMEFLLENDKREDLSRAHKLFGYVEGGLQPLAAIFKTHIISKGNAIVDDRLKAVEEDPNLKKSDGLNDPQFIQKMLDLHDHYRAVVVASFSSDSLFQKSLKEAFEQFLNRDLGKHSCAALMSHFCNRILKKGGTPERLSDEEVNIMIDKIVELFNFLTEKDLFAEIYRNQLSKRLLEDSSASDEAEKNMIMKLKLKCGAQFTSKMEGMCNDLKLATDDNNKFDTWCTENNKKQLGGMQAGGATSSSSSSTANNNDVNKITMEFGVTVLATGYWPQFPSTEIKLPRQLSVALDIFTEWYNQKTQHRKLTWIHSQGTAIVAAKIGKRHDLVCSTLQAVVLLLFSPNKGGSGEDKDKPVELKVEDIQREISANADQQIEAVQVKKILGTLACSKHQVLAVKRNGEIVDKPKTVSAEDLFCANVKFSCQHRKVKLPSVAQGTGKDGAEETHKQERIEEDRSFSIDAAIVRIMKARRRQTHQQLQAEVIQQLAFFKPNPKLIKQRIEHLIEREFLERDEDESNVYKYLA